MTQNTNMIKFNFDLSLKNCAHYGTLEGGLFPPWIYRNPAEYANRPTELRLIEEAH